MRLADRVEMLEIKDPGPHYPVLVWDDQELVLIDSSYLDQTAALRAEVERCGFTIDQITRVILTHQDIDHTGNAGVLRRLGATVLAGAVEAPFIQGDLPLTKITDLEGSDGGVPPQRQGFLDMLKELSPRLAVPVDLTLSDGQELPYCGGLRVVDTPGHTPGHVAIQLLESTIVVCGDAANISDGRLIGPNPQMTHDMAEGMVSFSRLTALGAAGYVCYHGGYVAA